MPELPDLEVMSRNLDQKLTGHALKEITIKVSKKLNVTTEALKKSILDKKLTSIYREGKELRMVFANHQVIGLHLMLHGELKVVKADEEVKFAIIKFSFDNDLVLYLSDFQKQATVTLNPDDPDVPDALSSKMDLDYLSAVLKKRKAAVKNVLLDQHIIRGIGNAYADEIFYACKISPFSICNKIPEKEVDNLHAAIRKVLNDAIKKISAVDPDRITGENRDFMKVHLPKKENTEKGEEILVEKHGARKTYYVESQQLYN
jgi:formamidopyrimidine-DNA glycosylase